MPPVEANKIVLTAHATARARERFPGFPEGDVVRLVDLLLDEAEPVGRGAHPTTKVMRHPAVTIVCEFTREETRVVTLLPAGWPISPPGTLERLANGTMPATGTSLLALQSYFGRYR